MPIEAIQAATAIFAVVFLAGCTTMGAADSAGDKSFGEATRRTLAAQVIDPDPQYDYADPTTSGTHAAAAVERYRLDKVKKPERITTSKSSGGSGNSGDQ